MSDTNFGKKMPLSPSAFAFLRAIRPRDAAGHRYSDDFAYLASAALYTFASQHVRDLAVMDAGCGLGFGSRILAQTARCVHAIDCDEQALTHARAHCRQPNLTFIHADARYTALADHSLDAVVCFEMIEHLAPAHTSALFDEWKRLLAPGGLVILSTPNQPLYDRISRTRGHRNEMTVKTFFTLLRSHFPRVEPCYQRKGEWERLGAYYRRVQRDRFHLRRFLPGALRRFIRARGAPGRQAPWPELWAQLQVHRATALSELEDAVIQVALCRNDPS